MAAETRVIVIPYDGSLPRVLSPPTRVLPVLEAIRSGPLKAPFCSLRGHLDRPYCCELHQREPIRRHIWQKDNDMTLAFRRMLHKDDCGREARLKGRDFDIPVRSKRPVPTRRSPQNRRSRTGRKRGSASPLDGDLQLRRRTCPRPTPS